MENTRELALDILMEILENGSYSHLVIRNVLDKYNYSDIRDKSFVKRITEGTLERLIQIDYVLNEFSKVPVSKMKPLIRNLMRLSVYQLLFMDSVPASAVCNEAVKIAGKRGFRGLSGFVNGVLRNVARNREQIKYPDINKNRQKALSVQYSMPEWLITMWEKAYGEETTVGLLEGLLKEHPVTVRVKENLSQKERKEWLSSLEEQKVIVRPHAYLPYAYILENTEGVRNLPGYEEGLFTVQDVSSMLAVEAAGVDKEADVNLDKLVIDVCAAPGGKSMHMAEKLGGRGKIISRDLTEYKVSMIRDNIERMGYTSVDAQMHDATMLDEALVEKADVVLADLPCSGLGIMGKKRDIKYRITPEALLELSELQKKILDVVWKYVKPGGVMIYSTCTMNPDENEKNVEWFLENYPFEIQSLSPYLPEVLKEAGAEGKIQLFSGMHETDGFFIVRLKRKDN